MAYKVNLNANQQLIIENRDIQTSIFLLSSSPGQQQSQGSSIKTGHWATIPKLFKTSSGFILQIESDRGQYFVQIQANSIQTLTTAPFLDHAQQLGLEEIDQTATSQSKMEFEPMAPMKPMKPMKMGNMSMSMNPMSMQMGNMSMQMGEEVKSTPTRRFCTQCGQEVEAIDRFCGSCGHQLKD